MILPERCGPPRTLWSSRNSMIPLSMVSPRSGPAPLSRAPVYDSALLSLRQRRSAAPRLPGALYGPAMAEGERAESGDGAGRPPSPGGQQRAEAEAEAEALKTRANEFFKGSGGAR